MTTHEQALEAAQIAFQERYELGCDTDQIELVVSAYLSALLPEDVAGLVERLRQYEGRQWETTACYNGTRDEAASLIQSQAARIAALEAGLEAIAVFPNPPTVSQARARALLNEDSTHD